MDQTENGSGGYEGGRIGPLAEFFLERAALVDFELAVVGDADRVALERYSIRIADDGQLEIDKSRAFQEELGQWVDPDSFVPV